MAKKTIGDPVTNSTLFASRHATHAALNHWFTRNRGLTGRGWTAEYQPRPSVQKLQCPAGISEVYWDTLAWAERRSSAPAQATQLNVSDAKNQNGRSQHRIYAGPSHGPVINPLEGVEPLVESEEVRKPVKLTVLPGGEDKQARVLPFPSGAHKWKDAGNW